VAFGLDAPTPQAQRLEDVLASDSSSKLRSSTASSLERETRRIVCVSVNALDLTNASQ
jgi:hypothetical protein